MGEILVSGMIMMFSFAMVTAALWKLFQIATELGEIKKLLVDMRGTQVAPALQAVSSVAPPPIMAGPISLESAEALLRQVEAESHALAQADRPQTTA